MKKVRFEDVDVLVGMEWTALSAEMPEKKALANYLSENKNVKKGVIMRSHGMTIVGSAPPKTPTPKKVPSAAALLAMANQKVIEEAGGLSSEGTAEEHSWIVAEQIEGTHEYWMAAVRNGLPLPGGDLVGSREKIIEEITDLLSTSANFTVFTLDKEVRYNVIGQVAVVEKTFAELIRGLPTKKAEPALFSIAAHVAVGVLVFSMLAVGGWWGYTQWIEKKKIEAQRAAAAAQQAAQAQQIAAAKAEYEKSVKDAMLLSLRQGMDELNASISAPSPYESVISWRDLIYSVDLYQGSWKMDGIECAVEETEVIIPFCTINLSRGTSGINSLLIEAIPEAQIDGDKASYTIKGSPVARRPGSFSLIGSARDFNVGLLSDLQTIAPTGVSHKVSASAEITRPVSLPAPPPTIMGGSEAKAPNVSIQLGYAKGDLSLSGRGVWQMSGVSRFLDQPNVRALSLSVNTSGLDGGQEPTWTLMMDYFIRTLPQPVIPPVTVGEANITVELPAEYRSQDPATGSIAPSDVQAVDPAAPEDEPAQDQGPEIPKL